MSTPESRSPVNKLPAEWLPETQANMQGLESSAVLDHSMTDLERDTAEHALEHGLDLPDRTVLGES